MMDMDDTWSHKTRRNVISTLKLGGKTVAKDSSSYCASICSKGTIWFEIDRMTIYLKLIKTVSGGNIAPQTF